MKVKKKAVIPIIQEMFSSGKTYQEIANHLGVTKQRVHQIAKMAGMVGAVLGGSAFQTAKKYEEKVLREICKYGCPKEERREIRSLCLKLGLPDPIVAFKNQRVAARQRNIEWRINFKQWWDFWKDHYENRGRRRENFVMARFGDLGPYEIGNVEIKTASENCSEIRKTRFVNKNRFSFFQ